MKKTISICLFAVILILCITAGIFLIPIRQQKSYHQTEKTETAEESAKAEETELVESMQVQKEYSYLLREENDRLVVYEKDGRTVLFETNIRLHGLDAHSLKLLKEGIWVSNEEELYDLLESYSS